LLFDYRFKAASPQAINPAIMNSMPRRTRTHRRDFLAGRSAAEALVDAADGVRAESAHETTRPPLAEKQGLLVHYGRRAMATRFEVILNSGQDELGAEAAMMALDLIEQIEDQLTVYRDHSEVMHINRTAASGPVPIEPRLFDLVALALALHRETSGGFDITSGPLAKVWGFYRREGRVPQANNLAAALAKTGSQHIRLDGGTRTIEFANPDLEINFGAIGKGYALDRAAEILRAIGVNDFLLHGGKSSLLASGNQGFNPVARGCLIAVGDPLYPDRQIAQIRLADRALGTSSTTHQFFRHHGRRYGHILDPRTGWPAEGVLQATVLAPTAALADALSTAFFVLGSEAAKTYCQQRPGFAALMVLPREKSGTARIESFGFQPGELT
jgi:thiamine biosynthesis lipoprotein